MKGRGGAVYAAYVLRLAALSSAVWGTRCLGRQLREERFLRQFLRSLPHGLEGSPAGALVALKGELSSRISFDVERRDDPRPLLRQSAVETLESGYGFCGENARAAILLLKMSGIRAHRLYLRGSRWGHVAVEQRWDDDWVLFDAHGDVGTRLADDDVGKIPTLDLGRFHNDYQQSNPWVRATRLKLLLSIPWTGADLWRPSPAVVALAERPYLLKAVLGLGAAIGCVALSGFVGKTSS